MMKKIKDRKAMFSRELKILDRKINYHPDKFKRWSDLVIFFYYKGE